jgi:UDP-GlcNAc:undecaprenyl-phosphate GlcNAc-1-phosphate transferase
VFASQDYLQNPLYWALFLGGMAATAALTPLVMRLAPRIGAVDRGGHRKVYEGAMPLLGGVAIAVPLLVLCAAATVAGFLTIHNWPWVLRNLPGRFDFLMSLAAMRENFAALAVGGLGIVALGVVDDVRGLRARYKLLGQVIVALFVCSTGHLISGISIPWIGDVRFGGMASTLITVLWIAGLINAFNLIDGLDGLASGIALIASAALAWMGVVTGNVFVVLLSTLLAGSLAAFLVYNFNPARIFLGDTGSMFLGFVLATATLTGQYRSEAALIVLAPLLALSFPIFETLVSMLRRFIRGVPIFAGDSHHTHHRLLRKGYSQRQVVLTLYAVSLLLGGAAVSIQAIPGESAWRWAPWVVAAGTLGWISWLAGYLRPTAFEKAMRRRRRNAILGALARYAALSLGYKAGAAERRAILDLCRAELRLCFLGAWFEGAQSLIASSGEASKDDTRLDGFDPVERLRLQSSSGHALVVHYQFDHKPDELERRDVTACLARIFEHAAVRPPGANIVDLNHKGERAGAAEDGAPL